MKSLVCGSDKAEILRRMKRVRTDTPRRWGVMTAHEMVCHLADGYRMALGELPVRIQTSWITRTLVKWIAIDLPLPWPHGIPSTVEIDQRGGGTRPGAFASDVAALEASIERVTAPSRSLVPQHPL